MKYILFIGFFSSLELFGATFVVDNVYKVNRDLFVEIHYNSGIINDVTEDICNLKSLNEVKGFIYLKYTSNKETTIKKINIERDCHVK